MTSLLADVPRLWQAARGRFFDFVGAVESPHAAGLARTNLKVALASLAAVRARGALALASIAVGIAAVIATVSIGAAVKQQSLDQYKALGIDVLMVRKAYSPSRDELTLEAVEGLAEIPEIDVVAPWTGRNLIVLYRGQSLEPSAMLGVTSAFASLGKLRVEVGRPLSNLDFRRRYCVVGSDLARNMRNLGADEVVGSQLRISGRLWTVVGVLQPHIGNVAQRIDPNSAVFMPITTVLRMPDARIGNAVARMAPGIDHRVAMAAVVGYFARRTPTINLQVTSARQLIEQMQSQGRLFTLMLGAIGSIALIVGGVGAMNVMVTAVTERRGEIGLRRAVGARRRDILTQFVIEAVVLCLLAGLIGTLLGVMGSLVICWILGWPLFVSVQAIVAGVAVSVGVGVFFGFYPARQASRLNPITALRT